MCVCVIFSYTRDRYVHFYSSMQFPIVIYIYYSLKRKSGNDSSNKISLENTPVKKDEI